MQRVTVTVDDELMAAVDALVARRGGNRSEAMRDLLRAGLQQVAEDDPAGPCVAVLVYAFDHGARELPRRLAHSFHDHRSIAVSTLHVHVSAETCVEATVLTGEAGEVRHLAEHVMAERGVRDGRLVLLPGAAVP